MQKIGLKSYRDLQVWQRGKRFAVQIYQVTKSFPPQEQYGLSDQMRRAAVSIPSNIAEGHIRRSNKVFANYLDIALGSAAELDTQIEIAAAVGYLSQTDSQQIAQELQEIMKMIRGLLKAVSS